VGATDGSLSMCHLTMNMLILSRCPLHSSPPPAPSPEHISALLARPSPTCCSADTVAVRLILDLALDLFDLPLLDRTAPSACWLHTVPARTSHVVHPEERRSAKSRESVAEVKGRSRRLVVAVDSEPESKQEGVRVEQAGRTQTGCS